MAQFDVLGFIRDLGDRAEAKKLIAANRDVLASGNPDAIQGLVAHAPTNQHYVGALKNVYDNLMASSALKTQSTGRLATRAGTDQTETQTSGMAQDIAHRAEQYNWLKQGRQDAINKMPGGMPATPEAVKFYTDMVNQYTGVKQNERNVDLTGAHVGNVEANTGLTNAHTGQVFGQENRANEDQTRRIGHEDAMARMLDAEGAGPLAYQVAQTRLGQGHLAEMVANNSAHTNLANKEFGLKSVQDLGAMLTNPAFMSPGQPNISDAVKRQFFDQFGQATGIDMSHMGPAAQRSSMDPAAIVRNAREGQKAPQAPAQTNQVPVQQPQPQSQVRPNSTQPKGANAWQPTSGMDPWSQMTAKPPTHPAEKMVAQIAKQYPEFHNDPRRPRFNNNNQLDPLEILSWAREAQRTGKYDADQIAAIIQQFMNSK